MNTFQDFVSELHSRGGVANLLFEENIYRLVSLLDRVVAVANQAQIAYEVVGGMAVYIYVEESDPARTMNTRDIDVMIDRPDFSRLQKAAESFGFEYRHVAGVDMLLPVGEQKAVNAVRILFTGEKVRPAQVLPHPPIRPESKDVKGTEAMVIPVADLVLMKLSAYRDKDRVHVRTLDECGLITVNVEQTLPPDLRERLQHIRETE